MSEAMRLKILNKLTSVIGEEEATQLMENTPPFDWHEIATKDDLAALKEWAEAKFDAQSASTAAEFAKVAAEFTAVRGEFAEKIGEVHKEIGGLHVAIAESAKQTTAQFVELSHKMDAMRRWGVGSVVAVAGAVVGSGVWFGWTEAGALIIPFLT
ncbi:MAG: hypothetical protein OXF75_05050 [Acidimicrobiaceae bacterium]|nr:hypothetical protein [Acidimicrobiaceae bacterium]